MWTGNSAIDIQIQLWQQSDLQQLKQPSLTALFSFVHLDPTTKKPSKAVQLLAESPEEIQLANDRQKVADARRLARQSAGQGQSMVMGKEALDVVSPLQKEARIVVQLPALAASNAIPMPLSALENTFMTVSVVLHSSSCSTDIQTYV